MPELPEVESVKNGLLSVCEGKTVVGIKFYRRDLREPIPTQLVKSVLLGEVIQDVSRRSKYILIHTAKGTVISHLGMTGAFLTRPTPKPDKKHTHFVMSLKDTQGSVYLHFVDPRRFGRLSATLVDPLEHVFLRSLGPEPIILGAKKLAEHLFKVSRSRKVPVKNFLMDQKVVVGVGNIYACEALFSAKLSPLRHSTDVSHSEYQELAQEVVKVLKKAIKQGGSTIKDFQNADGQGGYFAVSLKVYGKHGERCQVCSRPIVRIKQSGRSSWFCEGCQV